MDILELAKAKRRFKETYEYIKDSVARGGAYPVPQCFPVDDHDVFHEYRYVPNSVFSLINETIKSINNNQITWLASFDLEPMEQYCKMFGNYEHPLGIEDLTESLKDFHAWIEEMRGDGQTFESDCGIASNDKENADAANAYLVHQKHEEHGESIYGDEAHKEEVKEFARLFMEGGENDKNVRQATEILEHIKPLDNANIAHYLCDCMMFFERLNNGIKKKELYNWLKGHGYNVAGSNAFSKAFKPTKCE